MEQSLNLYREILDVFGCPQPEADSFSPLALAYIGDDIYDLLIRSLVMSRGNAPTDHMHRETSRLVCAQAQAQVLKALQPYLSEEEKDIARRGRNAKSATMAKHATAGEYRRATGLEALAGYLYLTGKTERLIEIVKLGLEEAGLI